MRGVEGRGADLDTNSTARYYLDQNYFNEKGKIRLGRVRCWHEKGTIDLEELLRIFDAWVSFDEGFVIQEQNTDTFEKRSVGVKCSKRGNDVYSWRIKNRLRELEELASMEDITFFDRGERDPKTSCLFITFTYDTKRNSKEVAWQNVGVEFNRAVSWLKRRYGELSIFRVWESFENGYPHIHAILLFKDAKFKVEYDRAGEARIEIEEKREMEGSWHSFIDVSAVQSFSKSVGYLIKYLSKVHSGSGDRSESKYEATLAMMWLYRKRAFGISGDFAKKLRTYRLESILHNSNKNPLIQKTLDDVPLPNHKKWVFVGVGGWSDIVSCAKKGQKSGLWTYQLARIPKDLSQPWGRS